MQTNLTFSLWDDVATPLKVKQVPSKDCGRSLEVPSIRISFGQRQKQTNSVALSPQANYTD
jgi:hypothetical protein